MEQFPVSLLALPPSCRQGLYSIEVLYHAKQTLFWPQLLACLAGHSIHLIRQILLILLGEDLTCDLRGMEHGMVLALKGGGIGRYPRRRDKVEDLQNSKHREEVENWASLEEGNQFGLKLLSLLEVAERSAS